jgi:hypothetical protein
VESKLLETPPSLPKEDLEILRQFEKIVVPMCLERAVTEEIAVVQ